MVKRYRWILITVVIALAVVVFYLAKVVSAVNHTVNTFDQAYFASLETKESDTINQCSIPGYIDLIRRKAYLSAQSKMAESDSIGLLINMRDSLIQLMIKGVVVRTVKMDDFDVSPFFQRANQEAIYSMLSTPLIVTGMSATFAKEPINIKIAPKDTTEVTTSIKPDTTDFESVYFNLETNRNINLFFEQQEDTVKTDRRTRFMFDLKDRLQEAKVTMKAVSRFETPPYTPYIKIRMPKAEAKIVYRAIPRECMVVLTQ